MTHIIGEDKKETTKPAPKDVGIYERRTFHIPRKGGGGDIDFDVNWNKDVSPCKYLKVKMGEEEGVIWLGDLYNLMLIWVDPEKRKGLISKEFQNMKSYETILGVKTIRAVEAGEELKIACTIQIDPTGRKEPAIYTKGVKSQFEL